MSYTVEVSHRADKALGRLDRKTATRIRDRIDLLALDPYNRRISDEREMVPGQRYSRAGDWRILFEVRESEKTVVIVTIQHRSRVYKDLKK
jgi:mRNA-degrading endonuclease RelE of RelBE toxin-antitoxin system